MQSSASFITEIVGVGPEPDSHASERISPKEFLTWAEKDLELGGKRGLGNALGNVKKALHSRIDEIIAKTHVRFTSDWNPRWVNTEQKLSVMRDIGIQHEAIVDVMTSDRNDYEHAYILPTARVIRAHLHAAQLWLEKSYTAYEFFPLGLVGLPLLGISAGAKRDGRSIRMARFGGPRRQVLYFCRPEKRLLTISPDGAEVSRDFKSFNAKDMLRIEAKHIRGAFAGGQSVALREESLKELLDLYREWMRKGQQDAKLPVSL